MMRFLLILWTCLLLVAGCGGPDGRGGADGSYRVTDSQGTEIVLPHKPRRIMTTHFHLDNMLLGVVPQDRVVAVSATMDDPDVSYTEPGQFLLPKRYPWTISFEGLIAFRPDLVIAKSGTAAERIQAFRDMGIPVYVVRQADSVEDIRHNITEIGAVCGEPENAARLNDRLERELREVEELIPTTVRFKRSCVLVSKMNHNYGGKGSSFDDLCRHAGVRNAVADIGVDNGQYIGKEVLLRADPYCFLLSSGWEKKHPGEDSFRKEFQEDPALGHLDAVKDGRVFYIEDKYLYASNQNIVWAVRNMANLVYGGVLPAKKEVFLKGYE